jgi:hypothetical protein
MTPADGTWPVLRPRYGPGKPVILEHVIDKRPQADRLLIAKLFGEARHHARWRDLTADEQAAAVAALRELAGGRGDLLTEVAGIFEGRGYGR